MSPCSSRGFSHIHRGPLRLNHQHDNQNQSKPAVVGGAVFLMWGVLRGEPTGAELWREETDMGWGCADKLLPVPLWVVSFEILQDAECTHQLKGWVKCHFLCKLFSSQAEIFYTKQVDISPSIRVWSAESLKLGCLPSVGTSCDHSWMKYKFCDACKPRKLDYFSFYAAVVFRMLPVLKWDTKVCTQATVHCMLSGWAHRAR